MFVVITSKPFVISILPSWIRDYTVLDKNTLTFYASFVLRLASMGLQAFLNNFSEVDGL
jgi:hypothetical protein